MYSFLAGEKEGETNRRGKKGSGHSYLKGPGTEARKGVQIPAVDKKKKRGGAIYRERHVSREALSLFKRVGKRICRGKMRLPGKERGGGETLVMSSKRAS